jgi:hypothetical protein
MGAFNNLLCAMFSREYRIYNPKVLSILTEQADYYRALPIVSNSIASALFNEHAMVLTDPCAVLRSAYKLRHRTLFREGFILSLGP